jgi:hypothetical protein
MRPKCLDFGKMSSKDGQKSGGMMQFTPNSPMHVRIVRCEEVHDLADRRLTGSEELRHVGAWVTKR